MIDFDIKIIDIDDAIMNNNIEIATTIISCLRADGLRFSSTQARTKARPLSTMQWEINL